MSSPFPFEPSANHLKFNLAAVWSPATSQGRHTHYGRCCAMASCPHSKGQNMGQKRGTLAKLFKTGILANWLRNRACLWHMPPLDTTSCCARRRVNSGGASVTFKWPEEEPDTSHTSRLLSNTRDGEFPFHSFIDMCKWAGGGKKRVESIGSMFAM